MRYLIIILIYCSFSLSAFSQISTENRRLQVKEYYGIINKAELSIVDSNYRKAQRFYKEAFKFKEPNGRDLYNYFLVSYFLEDTLSAKESLNQLAENGLKKQFILHDWNPLSSPFFDYISKDYDSIYSIAIKVKESQKIKELDSLKVRDQEILKIEPESSEGEIKKIQFNNLSGLKNWISKYGFPSFSNVGFFQEGNPSPRALPVSWFLMWHIRPLKTDLDSIYKQAVLDGYLLPDLYGLIIDQRDENYWTLLPENYESSSSRIRINYNRSKIYLENIEDYIRKLKFSYKNQDFVFTNALSFMLNKNTLLRQDK